MVSVDTEDDGTVTLHHLENGSKCHFKWSDVDEVIGMLTNYRMMREVAEHGGDDDENGRV
jgi:hypothetical protein